MELQRNDSLCLGPSIVQVMAVRSGGQLILSSEPHHGTWKGGSHPVLAGPALADPPLTPIVPVVDDDPVVLANTAAMLEDVGQGSAGTFRPSRC